MTSDKFVYLFGRIIPALSLVLSMTLRFVPKFTAQIKVVRDAQRCIGRDVSEGSIFQRAKNGLTILSIMITWSLENAIETADSMKSRGYGLPGRTAFSIYRFDSRDRTALMWLLFCGMYIVSGWIAGGLYWRYYPTMKGVPISPFPISFMLAYLALCLTPVILNLASDRNWRSIRENTERGRSRA
jgi:energy-coupling factor transport system permease protein